MENITANNRKYDKNCYGCNIFKMLCGKLISIVNLTKFNSLV